MRNLELVDGVSINELVIKDDIQCVTIDNDNNKVYYTTKDTIYGLEPHTQQVVCSIPLCDELADICIISAQYLPHHQSLCIATQNGHVILYNTVIGQVECVGSVESGLTGMAWSPDQEIVILTTGQDTLIMMTKDFEPITENQLNSDDFGERKPVTVGWGKKETQFHGSLGKEAAKKKEEKAHIKSEWDDGKIYVSWRGDGQYFVVSSINPESGCRWLRIWSRDCVLQSTSEDVNGLEQAVSWKPTGSLIASSQRLHHRQHIVFFEKNGLRHGEFPLPLDKIVTVKDIIWNTDSTVLANLHFKSSIAAIQWDPEHAYTLHTIMNGGQYLQYTWSWATHHSNWKSPEDNAYVAVIDGASLLMTPFRYMMVPPPMCAYSLQLPAPVNNVTFGPPECCNSVAVLLSDERLVIYDLIAQDNVDKFVSQLDSINHINLFLADLKKEDVTTTMYISYYSDRIPHPSLIRNDKVDKVCDAVRIALENIGHSKYFLSIITTYIKKTVPELDIALQKIKNLQEKSVDNNGIGVDAAFRYVLYMVDIHQLYNVALASYDFDLVLMVAEKSQMDPKEYLPYLNKLRVLESNYQKYTIDKHLKHYGKALQHISLCDGHFDECIQLIQDHSLYVEALKLYQFGTTPYKIIGKLYGEYLENERHYEEAALLYTRCDDETKALEMYQKVGNWRQALCLATKLQYSKEKKSDLCRELADYLHAHRQYSEAAYLLEHYIDDMEEAIVMLIDGSLWDDALLTMYRHNRMDIIETNLKPALLLNFNTYVSQLDGMMSQFETHKNRLAVVRETKEKRKQGLFDEDGVPDKDGDLFSDTSSIGRSSSYTASSSRISGRSSKNRRKAERKKYSLKEGSEFEEFALLQALCDIVMKVEKLKGDVGNLLKALIQCQYDIQAGELQLCMEKMVTSVDKSMNEIWKPDLDLDSSPVPSVLGPQSTANSIATAMMQANRGQPTNVQELSLKLPPKINKDTKWKLQQLQTKP
ncbi:elongator complex protein 1-like [Saccoglossus kowalevskii]